MLYKLKTVELRYKTEEELNEQLNNMLQDLSNSNDGLTVTVKQVLEHREKYDEILGNIDYMKLIIEIK